MKKELTWTIAVVIFVMAFTRQDNNIRIDGVINDNEWKDAKQYDLSGGGRLMMIKNNNELYVALAGTKQAWAHVYLSHGDTVRVLHASAALGEARYVKQNNLWRTIQTFKWELRGKQYSDELIKQQQDHYRQFGWVSNNNNMGNGMTFEFKLDLSRTDNNPAPFSCVIAEVPLSLHHFPVSLNDNTVLQRLVQGYTPDSLQFNPSSWEKIK